MTRSDYKSPKSQRARADDAAWPAVKKALDDGAELRRPSGLAKYYPYRRQFLCSPGSLSETRVTTLAELGILTRVADGVYVLTPVTP